MGLTRNKPLELGHATIAERIRKRKAMEFILLDVASQRFVVSSERDECERCLEDTAGTRLCRR